MADDAMKLAAPVTLLDGGLRGLPGPFVQPPQHQLALQLTAGEAPFAAQALPRRSVVDLRQMLFRSAWQTPEGSNAIDETPPIRKEALE